MSAIPGYLTIEEAASVIGVSRDSVYDYLAKGLLPGAIRPGRDYFIPARAVRAFRRQPRGNPNFRKGKDLA